MKDQDALLAALLLAHQNQVALAESVQLVSRWFQHHGLATVTQGLQTQLEQVVANSVAINRLLDDLESRRPRSVADALGLDLQR